MSELTKRSLFEIELSEIAQRKRPRIMNNAALTTLAQSSELGIVITLREEPLDLAVSCLALELFGDLVRLECGVDPELRTWMDQAPEWLLTNCLKEAEAEAKQWLLPDSPVAESEWDDLCKLGFVIQRRDAAESLRLAVTASILRRGSAPVSLPGMSELCETLRGVDSRLGETVSKETAMRLLGARACLVQSHGWLSALTLPETS